MRVLLVEDDEALSEAVCGYLRAKAFVVDAVPSLAQAGAALRAASTPRYCWTCTWPTGMA